MILLSHFSREEGWVLKGFVPIMFLSFLRSVQGVVENMKLKIKEERMNICAKAVSIHWPWGMCTVV